jgi:prevent-host-death family protein
MTLTQTRPPAPTIPAAPAVPQPAPEAQAIPQEWPQPEPQPKISQRDLRLRSREIMDAVEQGQTFTVTRNGREIGELVPKSHPRTLVPMDELFASAQGLPTIDAEKFWADIDAQVDPYIDDPWAR